MPSSKKQRPVRWVQVAVAGLGLMFVVEFLGLTFAFASNQALLLLCVPTFGAMLWGYWNTINRNGEP